MTQTGDNLRKMLLIQELRRINEVTIRIAI